MALVLSNVAKSFGNKTAVDDVSFNISKPGVFGLLGTNGAGKTTTIRMILGILSKDTGTIEWNGKPINRLTVRFGYLPEERGIYPKAKVMEQIIYFATLRGLSTKEAKKQAKYWFGRLGVEEYAKSTAESLSKGNQQKIQLIAALIHDPELVILDEPFSGLDPLNTDLFKDIINDLVKNGKRIVMSSHQMHTVEEYCNEILLLSKGKAVLSGNLKDIKRSYGRTNLFIDSESDLDKLAQEEDIKVVRKTPLGYEFKIKSDEQAYSILEKMIKSKIRVDRFEIREPSLHEIFVEKVGV